MALMEFLGQNIFNTVSMAAVDSNSDSVQNLFDHNPSFGYITIGFLGASTTVISVSFSASVISHVLIQNHNLKNFSVYYNGTTTNLLFSSTTNSDTSTYIAFASITASSIQLKMVEATDSGEKRLGEFIISNRKFQLERNPTIQSYNPATFRKQVIHSMPDGGTTVFNIKDKFRGTLAWDYVTVGFRDSLRTLFNSCEPFYFLTGPTATAWNGEAFEVNWLDKFDFKFSSNVEEAGFSGSISIQETPGT